CVVQQTIFQAEHLCNLVVSGYTVSMSKQQHSISVATSTPRPGDLGWNLGMVLRGYQERFEVAVTGMPCGIRGFQILSAIVHLDPPNQQALGAHLGIDRTVLTYLLD